MDYNELGEKLKELMKWDNEPLPHKMVCKRAKKRPKGRK